MNRYLHIGFHRPAEIKEDELRALFNHAADWLEYAPNCWIVSSEESTKTWADRVHEKMPNETVLVFEIELNTHAGWGSKLVVEWFKKQGVSN